MDELDGLYDLEMEDDCEEEVTIGQELPKDSFYGLNTPSGEFFFFSADEYSSPYHAVGELMDLIANDEHTLNLLMSNGFTVEKR